MARPAVARYCTISCAALARPKKTVAERFWSKVDKRGPDECWPWIASLAGNGYGRFYDGERLSVASRVAWSLVSGQPFPSGMLACHTCDNPICVNPAHLFVGTKHDNAVDMVAKGRCWQQAKTHCPHGHQYTVENTHRGSQGQRYCRACWSRQRRAA